MTTGGTFTLDSMTYNCAIAPLSIREWNALSPKAQWDVISALRGPDLLITYPLPLDRYAFWGVREGSNPPPIDVTVAVKYHTTAVIRAKMREVLRVGGMVNEHSTCITLPVHWSWPHHFPQHVRDAARHLRIVVRCCPVEDFIAARHTLVFPQDTHKATTP